jgi:hypothetical protein
VADLNALDPRNCEGRFGERPGDRRREPLAQVAFGDPVAELEASRPGPPVQAAAARRLTFEEDAEQDVPSTSPLVLPLAKQRDAIRERHRLIGDPRHPRT